MFRKNNSSQVKLNVDEKNNEIKGKAENQNRHYNIKKQSLGPNARRG